MPPCGQLNVNVNVNVNKQTEKKDAGAFQEPAYMQNKFYTIFYIWSLMHPLLLTAGCLSAASCVILGRYDGLTFWHGVCTVWHLCNCHVCHSWPESKASWVAALCYNYTCSRSQHSLWGHRPNHSWHLVKLLNIVGYSATCLETRANDGKRRRTWLMRLWNLTHHFSCFE